MNTFIRFGIALLFAFKVCAADALTEKLQRGLFEEEANHNLDAAIKEYQALVTQSDEQRKLVATALFRLGECYRKLGKTNEANTQYARILRDFSEQDQLVKLSRSLVASTTSDATAKQDPTLLRAFESRTAELRAELVRERAQLQRLQNMSQSELLKSGQFSSDTALNELQSQLRAVDQKIAALRGTGISLEHPDIKSASAVRKTIEQQIADRLVANLAAQGGRVRSLETQLKAVEGELAIRSKSAGANQSEGTTAGMTQAEAEELARVKALAQNSPDLLNAPYKEGLTPLQYAAREGFPTVLEFILTQGVNVNGPDRVAPPLVLAAERGHLRIVELLLNRGADVNAAAVGGNLAFIGKTALIAAVEKNFKAVAELLLARGADVNRTMRGGSTPLHAAVSTGSNMVTWLLEKKADPNVLTKPSGSYGGPPTIERSDFDSLYGATPLHLAARQGYAVIASLLLKSGALVNATNWAGATPLHIAVAVPHTNVMAVLLASGADPNLREHSAGATPLALAIQKNAEITEALLAAGAKLNEPAYERPGYVAYPLHLAAASSKPEILRALLAAKPNLEVTNNLGATPLWSAVIDNRTNNLQMLIEAGADIRHLLGGNSPLQSARSDVAVAMLLKAGADPNRAFEDGDTLLHRSTRFPNTAFVRALLEGGANPNVFNKKQETPYSIAESGAEGRITSGSNERERQANREQWKQLAQLLKEHGADIFMERRLRIKARRGANEFPVFSRGTNELNRFTLMELLGHVYQNGGQGYPGNSFGWPDFSNLSIHRVRKTNESVLFVDLANALKTGDCTADQWLEWGDEVEIPERVHPLNSYWPALSEDEAATLTNCAARAIQVRVSGETFSIKVQPALRAGLNLNQPVFQQPYYVFAYLPIFIRNVPLVSRKLRSTSDLTRVAVRRTDPQTKEVPTMTFDTTDVAIPNASSGSVPLSHSLWLRDGDVVEIPEKQ